MARSGNWPVTASTSSRQRVGRPGDGVRGPLVDRMRSALEAEDPGAKVLPYCLSGGTDNKSFSHLGIRGYGFAPLRLPAGMDFAGMFHGVDERVPVDALEFGCACCGGSSRPAETTQAVPRDCRWSVISRVEGSCPPCR